MTHAVPHDAQRLADIARETGTIIAKGLKGSYLEYANQPDVSAPESPSIGRVVRGPGDLRLRCTFFYVDPSLHVHIEKGEGDKKRWVGISGYPTSQGMNIDVDEEGGALLVNLRDALRERALVSLRELTGIAREKNGWARNVGIRYQANMSQQEEAFWAMTKMIVAAFRRAAETIQ
ncbi:MAG: hypothetical protein RL141_892 [Candidatus Parcubacteria bacterium]